VKTNKRTAVKARRRTVKPVVDPEVFVQAAEHLGENHCPCCSALARVLQSDGYSTPHHQFFNAVLRPSWCTDDYRAWYRFDELGGIELRSAEEEDYWQYDRRILNARILGLLLCAELAREGFIPPGFEPEKGAGQ
jgi:hypothetical protein